MRVLAAGGHTARFYTFDANALPEKGHTAGRQLAPEPWRVQVLNGATYAYTLKSHIEWPTMVPWTRTRTAKGAQCERATHCSISRTVS